MTHAQGLLEKHGLPGRDLHDLPSSPAAFPDGCHFRMEISSVDSVAELEAVAEESRKRDIPIHRVVSMGPGGTQTLTREELRAFAKIGKEAGIEVIVIPSPRAMFDTGSHYHSSWGHASGIRPRGSDQLAYMVQDVLRCIEEGIRGFLFYGEEVVQLFDQMRQQGDIPRETVFKLSYTAGVANPAGARLAESVGADSINPVTDLSLAMLGALRRTTRVPLDIVTVAGDGLGGINRFWEGAEIVRVCSPCYFKQEFAAGVEGARVKVKYCVIMQELIAGLNPELKLSGRAPKDLRLPDPPH